MFSLLRRGSFPKAGSAGCARLRAPRLVEEELGGEPLADDAKVDLGEPLQPESPQHLLSFVRGRRSKANLRGEQLSV
jgi:hypothetical protein